MQRVPRSFCRRMGGMNLSISWQLIRCKAIFLQAREVSANFDLPGAAEEKRWCAGDLLLLQRRKAYLLA